MSENDFDGRPQLTPYVRPDIVSLVDMRFNFPLSTSMKRRVSRIASCVLLAIACVSSIAGKNLDRRIVDTAEVGNPESEAVHGYVGSDVAVGVRGEHTFRQGRGWMRYAMKTFEDTPVTVSCMFVATDSASHTYDVVVEDSVIATRTTRAVGNTPMTAEILVPFALTKGRNNIAIIIRAREGTTPALRELRTIQDHNELQ